MRNYEVTFIVDPVLSDDEIKSTAKSYEDLLKNEGCNIVYLDEMGLKQLSFPINKRSSGIYYSIEISSLTGDFIPKVELSMRRDERIMRFLTVKLDKYGVKYNEDKRDGKFENKRKERKESRKPSRPQKPQAEKVAPKEKEAPVRAEKAAPKEKEAPVKAKKETPKAPVQSAGEEE